MLLRGASTNRGVEYLHVSEPAISTEVVHHGGHVTRIDEHLRRNDPRSARATLWPTLQHLITELRQGNENPLFHADRISRNLQSTIVHNVANGFLGPRNHDP